MTGIYRGVHSARNSCASKKVKSPLDIFAQSGNFRERVLLATNCEQNSQCAGFISERVPTYGIKIAGWCTADPHSRRRSESKLQKLQWYICWSTAKPILPNHTYTAYTQSRHVCNCIHMYAYMCVCVCVCVCAVHFQSHTRACKRKSHQASMASFVALP